jgi:hypothetical protein
VRIVPGQATTIGEDRVWLLPRKELVGTLQVLLQARRLLIPRELPHAELLMKELQNFKTKVTLAEQEEAMECWRESKQDDLVLAVGVAAWMGELTLPGLDEKPEAEVTRLIVL